MTCGLCLLEKKVCIGRGVSRMEIVEEVSNPVELCWWEPKDHRMETGTHLPGVQRSCRSIWCYRLVRSRDDRCLRFIGKEIPTISDKLRARSIKHTKLWS